MSDVRERLVDAVLGAIGGGFRFQAEDAVDAVLDVLSAEQASPERVERAAIEIGHFTEDGWLAVGISGQAFWVKQASAALVAAGPVVVVRDSEERLTDTGAGFSTFTLGELTLIQQGLWAVGAEDAVDPALVPDWRGLLARLRVSIQAKITEHGASVPPSKESPSTSKDLEAEGASVSPSSSSPAPSAEGNSEAAEEWERAEMWRRKANDLHARVSELEKAIQLHCETISAAGPLAGPFISEDLERMARKARADIALWALLSDTEGGQS